MAKWYSRTELLFGEQSTEKLKGSSVIIFGIGGVGGYAVEALARAGVGKLGLVDDDKICLTNVNRQIFATRKTVGLYKIDVAEERIKDINPDAEVEKYRLFYNGETADGIDLNNYDYIIDAVDTVTAKILLVLKAKEKGIKIISCMGAGNKVSPEMFKTGDIYETKICPLAKVMRRELKKRGIESLKVVYSEEPPLKPLPDSVCDCVHHCICPPGTVRKCTMRRSIPGSNSFVPATAGLILAGEVIKDLIDFKR